MSCFGIIITVTLFCIFYCFKKNAFISKIPIIISAGVSIIILLKLFNIEIEAYQASAKYLSYMIAPATLAFAYPLYKNSGILLKNKRMLYPALLIGTITAIISTYFCASVFQTQFKVILSILPKSVTMPIAIEISKNIGGILELTSCVVVITGILGGIAGHWVLRKINVKNDIATGLAIGTASHIIGTAACAEKKKARQVAAGTIALILTGIFSALLIPFVKYLVIN